MYAHLLASFAARSVSGIASPALRSAQLSTTMVRPRVTPTGHQATGPEAKADHRAQRPRLRAPVAGGER
jgi:hypothetical protein